MSISVEAQTRMLLEPEAIGLLAAHDVPYVQHRVANSADEAVDAAGQLGFPVVLKVVSPDVVHKTEVGGVITGLSDESAVRAAFGSLVASLTAHIPGARFDGALVCRQVDAQRELIIGATIDATFGRTVMVGLGGVFAEALADVAFRVVPVRHEDGLSMLRELRGLAVLTAHRGDGPVDLDAVAGLVVKVGDLVYSCPEITEIDLNPVVWSHGECLALDARIMVTGSAYGESTHHSDAPTSGSAGVAMR